MDAHAILTPDERLGEFVSSAPGQLGAERAAPRRAIERLCLVPVMPELGARPPPAAQPVPGLPASRPCLYRHLPRAAGLDRSGHGLLGAAGRVAASRAPAAADLHHELRARSFTRLIHDRQLSPPPADADGQAHQVRRDRRPRCEPASLALARTGDHAQPQL